MHTLLSIGSGFNAIEISFSVRLLAAAILGVLMGLERTIAGKHAGMRTYALVALASCLFCLVGTLASFELSMFSSINPLQIAGSIAIGIGFVGSGLAVVRSEHPGELTTASGILVVSAIGMACGFGLYIIASVTTILSVIILSLLSRVEGRIRSRLNHTEPIA